jgi:hypothetical protein
MSKIQKNIEKYFDDSFKAMLQEPTMISHKHLTSYHILKIYH